MTAPPQLHSPGRAWRRLREFTEGQLPHLLAGLDWLLLVLFALLMAISLANLYSANPAIFKKQAVLSGVGCGIIGALVLVDFRSVQRYSYYFYGMALVLLILTLFWGRIAGGSQRWLDLGLFRMQTSEPAKVFLVAVLSRYFAAPHRPFRFGIREMVVPVLLAALPFLLILLQPDLGTAMMFATVFCSYLLVVRIAKSFYFLSAGLFLVGTPLAWKFVLHDYQRERLITWILTLLGIRNDTLGGGYQVNQSKIAIGSGGMFGKGYLEGTQSHLAFLPEGHTDFIFAVFAEEWGFVGCLVLLGLYLALLLRCLFIAMSSTDRYSFYVVYGGMMLLFWQAMVNILMVLGLLPVVGVPLPMFSFGGSSLLASCTIVGAVLSLDHARRKGAVASGCGGAAV